MNNYWFEVYFFGAVTTKKDKKNKFYIRFFFLDGWIIVEAHNFFCNAKKTRVDYWIQGNIMHHTSNMRLCSLDLFKCNIQPNAYFTNNTNNIPIYWCHRYVFFFFFVFIDLVSFCEFQRATTKCITSNCISVWNWNKHWSWNFVLLTI